MNLAQRLRDVCGANPSGSARGPEGRAPHDSTAQTLGGEWREDRGHRYLVVDRIYHPGYRLGRVAVADCLPGTKGDGRDWSCC